MAAEVGEQPASIAERAAQALHDKARVAIPLGVALITGVFVALGIEGDTLGRLLRTSPYGVSTALLIAVLGATLPFVMAGLPPTQLVRVEIVAASLLLIATAVAIVVAVRGVRSREQPALDVVTLAMTRSTATLRVDASALSLSPDDRMLLKVATFSSATTATEAQYSCRHRTGDVQMYLPGSRAQDSDVAIPDAEVIHWGETGPTGKGDAGTTYTFAIRQQETRFVCAVSTLAERKNGAPDYRTSIALLDVSNLATAAHVAAD